MTDQDRDLRSQVERDMRDGMDRSDQLPKSQRDAYRRRWREKSEYDNWIEQLSSTRSESATGPANEDRDPQSDIVIDALANLFDSDFASGVVRAPFKLVAETFKLIRDVIVASFKAPFVTPFSTIAVFLLACFGVGFAYPDVLTSVVTQPAGSTVAVAAGLLIIAAHYSGCLLTVRRGRSWTRRIILGWYLVGPVLAFVAQIGSPR